MKGAIEFRVSGQNSEQVADELAKKLKTRFHANPVVKKQTPTDVATPGQKFDPGELSLIVHLAMISFEAYKLFVHDPQREKRSELINSWEHLIDWSRSKHPATTITAHIGDEHLPLHECDPEQLFVLTKKSFDAAVVAE